jgi:hypothetical protein
MIAKIGPTVAVVSLLLFINACRTTGPTESDVKIINGRPTNPDEFTQTVLLVFENNPDLFCTGVALSDNAVMTAAHCVLNNLAPGNIKAYQVNEVQPEMLGPERTIEGVRNTAIKIHDKAAPYVGKDLAEMRQAWSRLGPVDIAIAIFPDNSFTAPYVRIANSRRGLGRKATLVGFGASVYNFRTRQQLAGGRKRTIEVDGVTYLTDGQMLRITTLDRKGRPRADFQGPAGGDSGGPMFVHDQAAEAPPLLVGIVSNWKETKMGYTVFYTSTYSKEAISVLEDARAMGARIPSEPSPEN